MADEAPSLSYTCVRCAAPFQWKDSKPNMTICLGCTRVCICTDKCALRVPVSVQGSSGVREALVCSEACASTVRARGAVAVVQR